MIGADGKSGECPAFRPGQIKQTPAVQEPPVSDVAQDFEALTPGQLASNGMFVLGLQSATKGLESKLQVIINLVKDMKRHPYWRDFLISSGGENIERFQYGPGEFRAFIEAYRPGGCHTPVHALETLLRGTDAHATFQELLGIEK